MDDQLRHFLAVVEHGSFTAAARSVHLSQPSLSASIQRLEADLGTPLLHRLPRGARPTAAGTALVPHARASLASMRAGRRAVAEVAGLARGEVSIGGGATSCSYLLPPVLVAFRARYPGVTFRLRETYTPAVPEAVRSGELDLGVAQAPVPGELWHHDEVIVVGPPALARPCTAGIPPGTPFVTFPRGAATRRLLETHVPDAEIVVELGSIAAVKALSRAGMGLCLLSRASVQDELDHGDLVEVTDPRLPIRRALVLVHPGLDRLSPAARALRDAVLSAGNASR